MRLKSEIWVKAYIRGCASRGMPAVVVRHGDDTAGAIFVRVNRLDGTSTLYAPAPAGLSAAESERQWMRCFGTAAAQDSEVEALLARESDYDPDLWIVEVESREGAHGLDDWLVERD